MRNFLSNIFPFTDFLYLLQLEGYEAKRYFKTLKRFWWRRNLQKRGRLVWTKRVKITLAPAFLLCILTPPLTPLWIGLSNLLLTPYFEWKKRVIQKDATEKFRSDGEDTKVIMIAGSYGKTTTKNYIYELVKYNYKTQMVPGNINTLTGIANWIINDFRKGTEVLVAEVDPYYVGEIRRACEIIPPDIAILTNVGDQHLERLGTKQNLKKALMEIFEPACAGRYAKPGAVKIKGLKTNLDYALAVAEILKISKDIVSDTVKKLGKPDRRGDIKIINNFEVIDESYNISETTAKFGVDNALKIAKTKMKKLVVVTAGIPELGEENK